MDGNIFTDDATLWIIDPTPKPKEYLWKPQEDITAYELALCMPALLAVTGDCWQNWEQLINELPEGVQRHFEEIK